MTETPNMLASRYSRVSGTAQIAGTGLERQDDGTSLYCERKGYIEFEFDSDEGKSAWTGENLLTGVLGEWHEEVQKLGRGQRSRYKRGHNFIFEDVSRFTREGNSKAQEVIRAFMKAECVIHFTTKGMVIDQYNIDEPNIFIMLGLEAHQANIESTNKSKRLKNTRVIERKHLREGGRAIGRLPRWLTPTYDGQRRLRWEPEPKPEVAHVILHIFRMCAEGGMGCKTIAKELNRLWKEGDARYEPWGAKQKNHTKKPKGDPKWQEARVFAILKDRKLIGEFQPVLSLPKGQKYKARPRKPIGDPIPNHYPVVVPPALFYDAQRALGTRTKKEATSSSQTKRNLFLGLAFCGRCDAPMGCAYVPSGNFIPGTKRRPGRVGVMFCSAADTGACDHQNMSAPNTKKDGSKTHRYRSDHMVERLLAWVRGLDLTPPDRKQDIEALQAKGAELDEAIHLNKGRTAMWAKKADATLDETAADRVVTLGVERKTLEQEAANIRDQIAALQVAPSKEALKDEFADVIQRIDYHNWSPSPEVVAARLRVNVLLKQLVQKITFDNGAIKIVFKGSPDTVYVFDADGYPVTVTTRKAA